MYDQTKTKLYLIIKDFNKCLIIITFVIYNLNQNYGSIDKIEFFKNNYFPSSLLMSCE